MCQVTLSLKCPKKKLHNSVPDLTSQKCNHSKRRIKDVVSKHLIHLQQSPKMTSARLYKQINNIREAHVAFLLSLTGSYQTLTGPMFVFLRWNLRSVVLSINQKHKLWTFWNQDPTNMWLNENKNATTLPSLLINKSFNWYNKSQTQCNVHPLQAWCSWYQQVAFRPRPSSAPFPKPDVKAMHIKVLVSRAVPE